MCHHDQGRRVPGWRLAGTGLNRRWAGDDHRWSQVRDGPAWCRAGTGRSGHGARGDGRGR